MAGQVFLVELYSWKIKIPMVVLDMCMSTADVLPEAKCRAAEVIQRLWHKIGTPSRDRSSKHWFR